jgi:thioester reductase-like protein
MEAPSWDAARNPGVDRTRQAESVERGGRLSVATLLARVGVPDTGTGATVAVRALPPTRDAEELTAAVTAIAARYTGAGSIDPDTDFFEAGGTSVAAVELVATLSREFGIELPLDDLFADARPRELVRRWLASSGPASASALTSASTSLVVRPTLAPVAAPAPAVNDDLRQLMQDVADADSLPFVGPPPSTPPRRILLTGATGFLGSHLLLDLLRHSDAYVVCLVRAENDEAGMRRLGAALQGFRLPWSPEVERRVSVLAGDIRRPLLGLSEERWRESAGDVDSIVSTAAAVDFLRGYQSLRAANTIGPLTLARLAAEGPVKPLHHVSSIAVFNEVGIASMNEDDPVAHIDRLPAGYDMSKWAAEAALRRAREHGLTVTFMRPGGIGGHTETGAHNAHDFSSALLGAVSRFRTVPAFRYLNVAPVNWVSRVAAEIVGDPDAWGRNYNLTGVPRPLEDVVRDMAVGGMSVRIKSWEDWRADTIERVRSGPVPELEFLARMLKSPTARKLSEAAMAAPAAGGERTLAFVRAHDLPAPEPYDARAQQRTFEWLARNEVAVLPRVQDAPYLWFAETLKGSVRTAGGSGQDIPCGLSLTLSIASMYQLVTERRVDVRGELDCPAVHSEPLTVESGEVLVRPERGVPTRHGLRHPLLRYRLVLRDADGRRWWLDGQKTARPRRDVWRQARALEISLGREGEPALLAGEVVVPAESYLREQVEGIHVDPRLPEREQRMAKLRWLAWFWSSVGFGLADPMLRVAAELLDLRSGATDKEVR